VSGFVAFRAFAGLRDGVAYKVYKLRVDAFALVEELANAFYVKFQSIHLLSDVEVW
jgi:hypothetical protein